LRRNSQYHHWPNDSYREQAHSYSLIALRQTERG
jgi:hypothetical protein